MEGDVLLLAQVVHLLAGSRTRAETIQEVAQLLVPDRADWVFVDVLAADGRSFERVAIAHRSQAGAAADALRRVYPLASKASAGVEVAIRERTTQQLHDVDDELLRGMARDESHLAALRAISPRSWITVPLIARGEVFGALTLIACHREHGDADVRFAEHYAVAAAAVVENARLHEARQRARVRLERTQAVIAALSSARTATEVADVACQLGADAMEAYSGAIWLLEDDGSLALAGTWGTSAEFIGQFRSLPADGDAPAQQVMRTNQPLWIESEADYAAASPSVHARAREAGRLACFGVVPLLSGSTAFGVITFAHRPPHTYDEEDRAYYVVLAHHCAQALERARVHDLERAARDRFERLHRVTAELNKVTTREAIGDVCLPAICQAMQATVGALYLVDDDGQALEAVRLLGFPAEHVEKFRTVPLARRSALTEVVRTRTPMFLESRAAFEALFHEVSSPDIDARAIAPVMIGDRVLGVLGVAFRRARVFTDSDRTLFLALADPCGQALDRARLLERERQVLARVTREVQFNEMFVGILGHDLRTPLASIGMASNILSASAGLTESQRQMAQRIGMAGDRMTRMVAQLLDVTHTRLGGGLPIHRRPCDLTAIVRAVVAELELVHASCPFTCDGDGSVLGQWDPDRIGQVVSNLVGNAVTHGSPTESVRVSVTAAPTTAELRVHNVGPPIRPDVLPTIFEPYIRGRHDIEARGLGLGLYITGEIVHAHGGTINVASSAGSGTTFTVTLPR